MKRRQALKNTILSAGSFAATPTILSLLQSCQNQPRLSWTPLFFTDGEARLISAIVDRWLPKTETPGALDVNVDVFLDTFFTKVFNEEGKKMIRTEIASFNDRSRREAGDDFIFLSQKEQEDLMRKYESETAKFNPGIWGTAVGDQEPVGFYRQLKSMTLWAYYSSEAVGKNILNYDPIPGEWKACIDVSEVGNSWTL